MAFMTMNSIVALVAFSSLFAFASAHSGTATFYTPPYNPSACFGYTNEGVMIAAASDAFYDNGNACGDFYRVTCVGGPCRGSGSVVVKIVDFCPPGSCRGTIDLSQEAFASIADPSAGVIHVSFQKV